MIIWQNKNSVDLSPIEAHLNLALLVLDTHGGVQ